MHSLLILSRLVEQFDLLLKQRWIHSCRRMLHFHIAWTLGSLIFISTISSVQVVWAGEQSISSVNEGNGDEMPPSCDQFKSKPDCEDEWQLLNIVYRKGKEIVQRIEFIQGHELIISSVTIVLMFVVGIVVLPIFLWAAARLFRIIRNYSLRPIIKSVFFIWLRPHGQTGLTINTDPGRPLLEDQKNAIKRIIEEAKRLHKSQPGRMFGLQGAWGAGKSFVVQELLNQTDGESSIVATRINIWEVQREQNLHLAMVKAILANPTLFNKHFVDYPLIILMSIIIEFIAKLMPTGLELSLGSSRVSLAQGLSIPMAWQKLFRIVVDKAVSNGLRFIVILDEIDRADPPMAQAAITLARRSLDLPGILVVLPFVEEQIRYKVFNPTIAVSPDLEGTMEAVLDEEAAKLDKETREMLLNESNKDGKEESKDGKEEREKERWKKFLIRYYQHMVGTDPRARDYLFNRFSEKYLANSIQLRGVQGKNLSSFILDCNTSFKVMFSELVDGHKIDRKVMEGNINRLSERGLMIGSALLPENFTVRSLRKFEGMLDEGFSRTIREIEGLPDSDEKHAIIQAYLIHAIVFSCLFSQDLIYNTDIA